MLLIIAEKNLAGERIASILGGKTTKAHAQGFAKYYSFMRRDQPATVLPLRGHIVEVDFPVKYSHWRGTDLQELVRAPIRYNPSEPAIARLLRDFGKQATKVIIATDADREGESIGVEALRIVQETNASVQVERAYFSAMTPKELNQSFDELVKVDYPLADSADSRREIDLIWGAALTRYVSLTANRMGKEFISIGRVQTPVLALIVNREKERLAFVVRPYWEIKAVCEMDKIAFEAQHKEGKFWEEAKAKSIFEKIKGEKTAIVTRVSSRERTIARPTPFDTTQFLRSATVLGLTAGQAMNIAESLYMSGYISYPRTDNTVYPPALNVREHLEEMGNHPPYSKFVKDILSKPLNPSRGKKNTTDHPPIHPTKIPPANIGDRERKVFDLIARRFLATFMEDALTLNVSVDLDIGKEPFTATGQTILVPGWKAVYPYSVLKEIVLPALKKNDRVDVKKMDLLKKETMPPARYSQSSLIKLMEELNLGTKSTRHEIIQKLYSRKYISGLKNIEPNQIAFAVIDAFEKYCRIVTEPKMTAELEKEMDDVAAGKKGKSVVVEDSRTMLQGVLSQLLENKLSIAGELRKALSTQEILALCPKDGGNMIIRKAGATGKRFLGCSNYPNCTATFSLPQKGLLSRINTLCSKCQSPMIKLTGTRFKMDICLNYNCPSKDDWKKKMAGANGMPSSSASFPPPSPPSVPPKPFSLSKPSKRRTTKKLS
ncbi:MAG: DNA topoisomerase I [Candidatus Diapherotrites archaeon]